MWISPREAQEKSSPPFFTYQDGLSWHLRSFALQLPTQAHVVYIDINFKLTFVLDLQRFLLRITSLVYYRKLGNRKLCACMQ